MAKIEFTSWELKAYLTIRELILVNSYDKNSSSNFNEYVKALQKLIAQFEEKYGGKTDGKG